MITILVADADVGASAAVGLVPAAVAVGDEAACW